MKSFQMVHDTCFNGFSSKERAILPGKLAFLSEKTAQGLIFMKNYPLQDVILPQS